MEKKTKKQINNILMLMLSFAYMFGSLNITSKKVLPTYADEQRYFYETIDPSLNDLKETYKKDDDSYKNIRFETIINNEVTWGKQTSYTTSRMIDTNITNIKTLTITELNYASVIAQATIEPLYFSFNRLPNNATFDTGLLTVVQTRNNPYKLLDNVNISQENLTGNLINQLMQKDIGNKDKYTLELQGVGEQLMPPFDVTTNIFKTLYFYMYTDIYILGKAINLELNTTYNLEGYYTAITTITHVDVIDLPGLLFNILTMPFAFISTAFNVTLFSGTEYAINLSNIYFGLFAIGVIIFIIRFTLLGGGK